jgi:hypothetical protein
MRIWNGLTAETPHNGHENKNIQITMKLLHIRQTGESKKLPSSLFSSDELFKIHQLDIACCCRAVITTL